MQLHIHPPLSLYPPSFSPVSLPLPPSPSPFLPSLPPSLSSLPPSLSPSLPPPHSLLAEIINAYEPWHVKKLRSWAVGECLDHIRADDQFTDCISIGPVSHSSSDVCVCVVCVCMEHVLCACHVTLACPSSSSPLRSPR